MDSAIGKDPDGLDRHSKKKKKKKRKKKKKKVKNSDTDVFPPFSKTFLARLCEQAERYDGELYTYYGNSGVLSC